MLVLVIPQFHHLFYCFEFLFLVLLRLFPDKLGCVRSQEIQYLLACQCPYKLKLIRALGTAWHVI